MTLESNPSHGNFGQPDEVYYTEGIFVGYRFYQMHKTQVLFPFGHGLSYTTFEYSGLKLDKSSMKDNETLSVTLSVKNTGQRAGKEVVQLYVSDEECTVARPIRELKKFAKVLLLPNEKKEVKFELSFRDFAFWSTKINKWYVETGDFSIEVGASSEDIRLKHKVHVQGTIEIPLVVGPNTQMGVLRSNPKTRELAQSIARRFKQAFGDPNAGLGEGTGDLMANDSTTNMPLRAMSSFIKDLGSVSDLVDQFNEMLKK